MKSNSEPTRFVVSPYATIAIDGPAASGKSTVGAALAERLGYVYFDTGVMYRAVTRAALDRHVAVSDAAAMTQLAETVAIDVVAPTVADGRPATVLLDGQDVTWSIRWPDVNGLVSEVSAIPGVRTAMTSQQRRIGSRGQIVMTGRDIGTVVLPNADLKIFLQASAEARARRRWLEEQTRGGSRTYDEVLDDIRHRDDIDSNRPIAPLRPAEDAVIVDTTHLSEAEVVAEVLALATRGGRS